MTKLRYFTSEAVEHLRQSVGDRLDEYFAPKGSIRAASSLDGVRESRLNAPTLNQGLAIDDKTPSATDVRNSLYVYHALSDLTLHQASIERLWVYLCHCDCPRYISQRWLKQRPEMDEDAIRMVNNHFFATGNRGLIRDNGVSRLWWLGKIAQDVDPKDPSGFLSILLHRQDIRSALIERPSVSMNRRVLRGVYAVMLEHWNNGGLLFKRTNFRSWMVALNRRGGVVLLDAMPDAELARLLHDEANRALADH